MLNFIRTIKSRLPSGIISTAITLIIIIFLSIVWSNSASKINHDEGLRIAYDSVRRAAISCYATEGSYPPNIDYLVDNYALSVNRERYLIHYEIFASNIMPDIQIIDKLS